MSAVHPNPAHPNPALRALGLADDDRVVIVHADDVGMCHATIPAAVELLQTGLVTSVSVMAPCPWARAAVDALAEVPGADLGVHWTVTAEWPSYRWPSLTRAAELDDADRFLPRTNEEVRAAAPAPVVAAELERQLDSVLAWEAPLSHVDSHMGAIATPAYLPAAVEIALARGVLPMFPRFDADGWRSTGLDGEAAGLAAAYSAHLEERGLPMVDHLRSLPLHDPDDQPALLRTMIDELPPGITHLYAHPALDTPELRAATTDWPSRVANLEALRDPGVIEHVRRSGVRLVGYDALQALLP